MKLTFQTQTVLQDVRNVDVRFQPRHADGLGSDASVCKWIRIAGIRNHVLSQARSVEQQDILNRTSAGTIVEDAGAATENELLTVAWCIGEREARRKIIIVMKIILPVVAQTKREHQILAQVIFVLSKKPDVLFEKDNMPVSQLLHERER